MQKLVLLLLLAGCAVDHGLGEQNGAAGAVAIHDENLVCSGRFCPRQALPKPKQCNPNNQADDATYRVMHEVIDTAGCVRNGAVPNCTLEFQGGPAGVLEYWCECPGQDYKVLADLYPISPTSVHMITLGADATVYPPDPSHEWPILNCLADCTGHCVQYF